MKNATLTVLLLLSLGVTWVGVAAAQADEPEGDAASEPAQDGAEGGVEAPPDEVIEEATEEATEEAAEEPAVEELPVDDLAASGSDLGTPEEAAPAEEEEAEEPSAVPSPWRNTFLSYTNQVTFNSFLRGAQLSYNPAWNMSLTLLPRWYVPGAGFFRATLGVSVELTDADDNALNHEPLFGDILIDYIHPISFEGFIFMPSARIGIPVSRASLAVQRFLSAGFGLTVVRPIPEAANLTFAAVFRYTRWFAGSNMIQVGEPQPDRCPQAPPSRAGTGIDAPEINTVTCDQLGTSSAASDVILAGLSVSINPTSELSISASGFMFTTQGYGLAPAYVDVETREEPLRIDDGSPNHFRNFTYFSLSAAYQFLPWFSLELGIQNAAVVAPLYNPDGNLRNPIFTPDTEAYLTATIGIDGLIDSLTHGEDDGLTPEERQRRRQGLSSGPRVGGAF